VKGLYAKARAGELKDFTGISAPFEAPPSPALRIATADRSEEASATNSSNFILPRLAELKPMHSYRLTHLKELESESMHILREVAAQFENPALLFSGGKDSIVCFHLARKAFFPAKVPFPLVHVDTGHNFEETMTFRDNLVKEHGAKLIVGSVQESIDRRQSAGGNRLLRQPQQTADGDPARYHGETQDRLRHRRRSP
jgi:hypothetical protein